MAENEMLDVGNPAHYRRWRRARADNNCAPADVADCLAEDFFALCRKKLRGAPLYLVIKACGKDRDALRAAVSELQDRALGKFVEQACSITNSLEPQMVASKIAELMIDGLLDRTQRYSIRDGNRVGTLRELELKKTASERLEACKPIVTAWLAASLRGERPTSVPRKRKPGTTARAVVGTSLLQSSVTPLHGTHHV